MPNKNEIPSKKIQMTIPKSILKSSHENVNLIAKHVNFESQPDESE